MIYYRFVIVTGTFKAFGKLRFNFAFFFILILLRLQVIFCLQLNLCLQFENQLTFFLDPFAIQVMLMRMLVKHHNTILLLPRKLLVHFWCNNGSLTYTKVGVILELRGTASSKLNFCWVIKNIYILYFYL